MKQDTPWDFPIYNLKKVKDWIPAPTQCHYCFSEVVIKTHEEVYGKTYGDWPYLYVCTKCGATIGIHKGTNVPMGYLANKPLRQQRQKVKGRSLQLKEKFNISTRVSYDILSKEMGYSEKNCHFGMFLHKDLVLADKAIDKIYRRLSKLEIKL